MIEVPESDDDEENQRLFSSVFVTLYDILRHSSGTVRVLPTVAPVPCHTNGVKGLVAP